MYASLLNLNQTTRQLRVASLTTLLALSAVTTGVAAFVPLPEATPENPGVSLDSGTPGVAGTVIAAQDSLFNVSADFAGVLRSLVVDTGSGYDFYYQIKYNGPDTGSGAEIYRMKTVGGFDGSTLSVSYRTDLTGLDLTAFPTGPVGGAGAYEVGTKSLFSADRDEGSVGSVGFDFPSSHFLFDPANLTPGQTSMIAVVRTNATGFNTVNVDISGFGTARVSSFAVVPEAQAFGLVAIGSVVLLRRRAYRW